VREALRGGGEGGVGARGDDAGEGEELEVREVVGLD
jgi:hypothetical protein